MTPGRQKQEMSTVNRLSVSLTCTVLSTPSYPRLSGGVCQTLLVVEDPNKVNLGSV